MGRKKISGGEASAILLQRVELRGLFGHKNYNLDFSGGIDPNGNISILYGENGSGKTTILRLIYSILARPGYGTKTYIAKTEFDSATIELSNGHKIEVRKEKPIGSYRVNISSPERKVSKHRIIAKENGLVRAEDNVDLDKLEADLIDLDVDLVYVSDKREFQTTVEDFQRRLSRRIEATGYRDTEDAPAERAPRSTLEAEDVAYLAREVLRSQFISLGNSGQRNANTIYLELANSIVQGRKKSSRAIKKAELVDRLWSLSAKVQAAASLEFVPPMEASGFKAAIESAGPKEFGLLAQVLTPYFDGLDARLNAIEPYVNRIKSFLDEINRFYSEKQFSFSMSRGFAVETSTGPHIRKMSLAQLSSGERQLFTILASIFLTQQSAGIVLIDEPELSLNVLWQRNFVEALKRIGSGSFMQYVLASHSLEILAHQEKRVVLLNAGARRESTAS